MDRLELRTFRVALVETDAAIAPDDPRYVPGLHGTNEEDVISALYKEILTHPDQIATCFISRVSVAPARAQSFADWSKCYWVTGRR